MVGSTLAPTPQLRQRLQVNLDAGGGGSLIVEVHDAAASPCL